MQVILVKYFVTVGAKKVTSDCGPKIVKRITHGKKVLRVYLSLAS